MKLYDDIINEINALCDSAERRDLEVNKADTWEDGGNSNMVLRNEAAFELGGAEGKLPAVGGTAITDNEELVGEDSIVLIGPDISEISGETPYARIAIVRVKPETMGEGNALYSAIRNIEYLRYHMNPKGFMMRVSTIRNRESVRIAKEAIAKGISFQKVGNFMLNTFHLNPKVEAVKLIYITDPNFNYAALKTQLAESEKVTKAIDHILKNVMTDCDTCSLQKVCEEVEGMKELHFGLSKTPFMEE